MKILSAIIALLLVTILLTLAAMHDPGYVLIERSPWSVEMPLTLFGLLLIVAVILLYGLLHMTVRLVRLPKDVGRWRLDRRLRHQQKALHSGLIKFLEGDHAGAEKDLVGDIKTDSVPGIHYLAAACAAQGQGHPEKRDEYLTQAHNVPGLGLAAGLLQAYLYEAAREYERSLATLNALRISHPGNRRVLRLLAQRARGLRDWTTIAQLTPELRRYKVMEPAAIDDLERDAHRHLLVLASQHAPGEIEAAWRAIPKAHRQHPSLVAIYARSLIRQGAIEEAERLLSPALRHEPADELFAAYGELHGDNALRFLSQAETWLKAAPQNATLLLALAKLAQAANLPGKAREYAERCARQNPPPDLYAELALVMERLGDEARAREYCRRGLDLQKTKNDNGRPVEPLLLPLP
ncbi:heme biosynthesis HemY N-terminal domain-containing protein [Acidiferrobacter sp.]|uniref:heme biosynthesis HemY N-terminal domain-containing protein n=1 Tax=Acidiferrobacter sp. TaxID=1872107 RepID=UPI0026328F59|nr:heme biosynthesis HemY N-terminal domain-containing protein [Acidiferrobacter sp.]